MQASSNDRRSFFEEIYTIAQQIPYGKVATYGDLARLAGRPECARLAGQAMWSVPAERAVPCHRVVNSSGRLVPGWTEQRIMLKEEGVAFRSNGCVDMKKHRWMPE